jgi:hypothetical protein
LVFLVESKEAHAGSILLLDEPGHSLHPLAQRDLSSFFDNLSKSSQIVYTTHSPFMLDYDRLDRVKAVYVDADGTTRASDNLRGAGVTGESQTRSIYPAHAALGLSVSEGILLGCKVIVVEGESDQNYLSAIKILLVSGGHIAPSRELVFIPAGGVKGVKAVVAIVSGKNDALPNVFLDDDKTGREFGANLVNGLYSDVKERVLSVKDFAPGITDAEVEDLLPPELLVDLAGRTLLRVEEGEFALDKKAGRSIVPQMEQFAAENEIALTIPGWKVELSKKVKTKLLNSGLAGIDPKLIERWKKLFEKLLA